MTDRGYKKITSFGVYLLIIATIWSPYFTPPSTIGPQGILRLDQIVLPLVVVGLAISQVPNLRISVSSPGAICLVITVLVLLSTLFGVFNHGYPLRISDVFDLIIWSTYALFILVVAAVLPSMVARKGTILLIIAGTLAAILSILQILDFSIANEAIGPLYTYDPHLRTLGRRTTGPTVNPNIFGQLLSIPLFLSFALILSASRGNAPNWLTKRSPIFATSFVITGAGILATYSRTSLLTAAIGCTTIVMIVLVCRLGASLWRKRLLATIVTGIAGVSFALPLFGIDLGRFARLSNPLQAHSLQMRFAKWEKVLPYIIESSILGHGPSKLGLGTLAPFAIDSGVLSWWFHYGIIGVFALLAFLVVIFVVGVRTFTDARTFETDPIGWAAAAALIGWTSGTIAVWPVMTVAQSRRNFTLFLILVVFVLAIARSDSGQKYSKKS